MKLFSKLLVGAATVGLVLSPVLVRAEEANVVLRNSTSAEFGKREDQGFGVRLVLPKLIEVKKLFGKEHKGIGKTLGVRANTTTTATTTIKIKHAVRGVAQVWHEYRATVQVAEKAYKKSEHGARVGLMQALRVAVKTKDGAMAITALEAYFKSDAEADAKLGATRVKAREELMVDIRALF